MKTKSLIRLGQIMGLQFNEAANYPQDLERGRVVFDGINGQRFLFEASWRDDKIHKELGKCLIRYGERKKCMELSRALSINN